jgi:hypothetical protein
MHKYNTIQNHGNPTYLEQRHTPRVIKISDHEIEIVIDFVFVTDRNKKRKKFLYLCDSNGRIIEERQLKKLEKYKEGKIVEIFDINEINEREKEESEIDDREEIPNYRDVEDKYHAIFHCDVHGDWVDENFPIGY